MLIFIFMELRKDSSVRVPCQAGSTPNTKGDPGSCGCVVVLLFTLVKRERACWGQVHAGRGRRSASACRQPSSRSSTQGDAQAAPAPPLLPPAHTAGTQTHAQPRQACRPPLPPQAHLHGQAGGEGGGAGVGVHHHFHGVRHAVVGGARKAGAAKERGHCGRQGDVQVGLGWAGWAGRRWVNAAGGAVGSRCCCLPCPACLPSIGPTAPLGQWASRTHPLRTFRCR